MAKQKDKGARAPKAEGAKPAGKPAKPDKHKDKRKRDKGDKHVKVVRDSFTMPEKDYALIGELKAKCMRLGVPMKKSELLRAGLYALVQMDDGQLRQRLEGLERVKTGRPKTGK